MNHYPDLVAGIATGAIIRWGNISLPAIFSAATLLNYLSAYRLLQHLLSTAPITLRRLYPHLYSINFGAIAI